MKRAFFSNIGALDLNQIPKSMLIVGSGAVGVEFASIYNSFGTKVTLLEVLPSIRSDRGRRDFQRTEARLHQEGHRGLYKGETGKCEGHRNRRRGNVSDGKGGGQEVHLDKMLMATGRGPNTSSIGLDKTRCRHGAWIRQGRTSTWRPMSRVFTRLATSRHHRFWLTWRSRKELSPSKKSPASMLFRSSTTRSLRARIVIRRSPV